MRVRLLDPMMPIMLISVLTAVAVGGEVARLDEHIAEVEVLGDGTVMVEAWR